MTRLFSLRFAGVSELGRPTVPPPGNLWVGAVVCVARGSRASCKARGAAVVPAAWALEYTKASPAMTPSNGKERAQPRRAVRGALGCCLGGLQAVCTSDLLHRISVSLKLLRMTIDLCTLPQEAAARRVPRAQKIVDKQGAARLQGETRLHLCRLRARAACAQCYWPCMPIRCRKSRAPLALVGALIAPAGGVYKVCASAAIGAERRPHVFDLGRVEPEFRQLVLFYTKPRN